MNWYRSQCFNKFNFMKYYVFRLSVLTGSYSCINQTGGSSTYGRMPILSIEMCWLITTNVSLKTAQNILILLVFLFIIVPSLWLNYWLRQSFLAYLIQLVKCWICSSFFCLCFIVHDNSISINSLANQIYRGNKLNY